MQCRCGMWGCTSTRQVICTGSAQLAVVRTPLALRLHCQWQLPHYVQVDPPSASLPVCSCRCRQCMQCMLSGIRNRDTCAAVTQDTSAPQSKQNQFFTSCLASFSGTHNNLALAALSHPADGHASQSYFCLTMPTEVDEAIADIQCGARTIRWGLALHCSRGDSERRGGRRSPGRGFVCVPRRTLKRRVAASVTLIGPCFTIVLASESSNHGFSRTRLEGGMALATHNASS